MSFSLTLDSAMFNGQMLFDRQMHVKMVCYFWLLYNFCCTEDVKKNHYICCAVLQDEKSLPPDDFRQVEKTSQLPSEYTVIMLSIVEIRSTEIRSLKLFWH